jgi:hypothetical protein
VDGPYGRSLHHVNYKLDACSRSMYGLGMAKRTPLGIRLEDDEHAALEKAAAQEVLSMSTLGRKILVEWLRKNGFLKKGSK